MKYGAHLPLIDFDGHGFRPGALATYADTARQLGYSYLSANDHLVFQRPWLDGVVALASVLDRSGDMGLATTIALPVVRGPAALAKSAAALDLLSGGRFVLGVGPGSSARDYASAGVPFEERWPRFDEAVRVLRAQLRDGPPVEGRYYSSDPALQPRPSRVGAPPIWVGSWGSDAGLRRVARLADGWLASAYNLTAGELGKARERLGDALRSAGRSAEGFPCSLATMWTYVTEDRRERATYLSALAGMLNRPEDELARQVLVGPAEEGAALLRAYAQAGVNQVFIWPLGDPETQIERVMRAVAPLV